MGPREIWMESLSDFHANFNDWWLRCQNWIRCWLGAVGQQAIAWANVDPGHYCNMASLGCNVLLSYSNDLRGNLLVISDKIFKTYKTCIIYDGDGVHVYYATKSWYYLIWVQYFFHESCLYKPNQWETTLQCDVPSLWLGAFTKWSLFLGVSSTNYVL